MLPLVLILAIAWSDSVGLRRLKPQYNASPGVAQSQVGLARLRLAAGDARSALTFIRKAIELDSRDVSALKLAARIYGTLDRPREAVGALESAAVLAPRDASIRYQLARAYQSVGDTVRSPVPHCASLNALRAIYGP